MVDRRQEAGGVAVYRRLTVTALSSTPEGVPRREVFRLTRKGPRAL